MDWMDASAEADSSFEELFFCVWPSGVWSGLNGDRKSGWRWLITELCRVERKELQ